ncbi:MAG TPA: isocitrate lyase/phosphoenolpyruvate mutase family protein [Actinocrinis sp.]|nr:isocitrate lyase/phosphoenolpyruvate mutase family protein [Actinocrinis sp.]
MTTIDENAATAERARRFRELHVPGTPLVLANAWDVASARVVEDAGAAAVATTSAGVAWALGFPDGDRLPREQAVDLVARVAAVVAVPVSADIENGFADKPDGVAETVRQIVAAGAAGVNIEDIAYPDSGATPLPVAEQAERLAAARAAADEAGVPLYINARIDTYLRELGDPDDRFAATVQRATAYLNAGASGVFVPGIADRETIAALVEAVDAPVNVLAGPGSPTIGELARLGVARVSLGSSVAQAAYGLARRAAHEAFTQGTYSALGDPVTYGELNTLLHR